VQLDGSPVPYLLEPVELSGRWLGPVGVAGVAEDSVYGRSARAGGAVVEEGFAFGPFAVEEEVEEEEVEAVEEEVEEEEVEEVEVEAVVEEVAVEAVVTGMVIHRLAIHRLAIHRMATSRATRTMRVPRFSLKFIQLVRRQTRMFL